MEASKQHPRKNMLKKINYYLQISSSTNVLWPLYDELVSYKD